MNRQMRRASLANGRKLQKLDWNEWEDCTQQMFQISIARNRRVIPDKALKNNKYIVQIFYKNRGMFGKFFDKYMIRRSDSEPVKDWHDIQRIKNEIIGEDREAFQIFPKQKELVDVANLYWLWVESDQ